ncbi:TlpA family protein disulfide reductase [Nitratifractor sp.]
MKRTLTMLMLGGALTLLQPLSAENAPAQAAAQTMPQRQFDFTDIQGKKISVVVSEKGIAFPTLKGKSVIMLFYIYTGTPCRNELKLFSKLKPELKDLEFITFELKGLKPAEFPTFEKELGIHDLHMIDSAQAIPFAQYIGQLIRWPGTVPLIIAVNKKGEVKHMQLGAMNEEETRKLAKLLEG